MYAIRSYYAGLWFRLKRSGDTFLVQTKVCESLSLVSDQLAISEDEAFSSWFWWEIDSIDVANYVSAQMKAKRFSLFEERVCNLGDPGLSWWFFQEQDVITSYSIHYTKLYERDRCSYPRF